MGGDTVVIVTSLNRSVYEATGREAIRSWIEFFKSPVVLYVEENDASYCDETEHAEIVRFDNDPWLNTWLIVNGHSIPRCHVGTRSGKMAARGTNVALRARKTAALQHAFRRARPGRVVVWLDADIVATERTSLSDIVSGYDIVYACGNLRKRNGGIDTGLLALRKTDGVGAVMDAVRTRYDEMASRWRSLYRPHDDGRHDRVLGDVVREMSLAECDYSASEHRLEGGVVCKDMRSGWGFLSGNHPHRSKKKNKRKN